MSYNADFLVRSRRAFFAISNGLQIVIYGMFVFYIVDVDGYYNNATPMSSLL